MNRDCNENLPWIHVCGHFNTIQSILICGMNNVAVQQPSLKLLILNSFTGFSNHTLLLLRISMWWYPIFDNRIQLGWMGWIFSIDKVYADFQRKLPNLMKNNWKTSTTIIVCKWNVNCCVCGMWLLLWPASAVSLCPGVLFIHLEAGGQPSCPVTRLQHRPVQGLNRDHVNSCWRRTTWLKEKPCWNLSRIHYPAGLDSIQIWPLLVSTGMQELTTTSRVSDKLHLTAKADTDYHSMSCRLWITVNWSPSFSFILYYYVLLTILICLKLHTGNCITIFLSTLLTKNNTSPKSSD